MRRARWRTGRWTKRGTTSPGPASSPTHSMASRASSSTAPRDYLSISMSILDRIGGPADIRGLSTEELETLAADIRERLIDVCSRTGGHIGAGLGVVELSIALHYAFDTPRDQLVWDVGHQGYPHKVLTGRNVQLETLRQEGGISGFLKRTESEYDTFGAGHAATAISAALGMAAAGDINGQADFKVVAILGDGAL